MECDISDSLAAAKAKIGWTEDIAMSQERFQTDTALDMVYLCGCVLANTKPDEAHLAGIDLKALYQMSNFHSLTALVCEALEMASYVPDPDRQPYMASFQMAKAKSIRKNLLLDTEREKLLSFMEKNGIWYMPLKGVVLKDMYPKMGLRQMADNDILFDEAYRKDIHDHFVAEGYAVKIYGMRNHDVYLKEPVYNYEMHVSLYGEMHKADWYAYYKNIKARLLKASARLYEYRFSDEDFYIYFLTHGFKHFNVSGTGFRFLLDLYVYLEKKRDTMDWAYIEKELAVLDIVDFERDCRALVEEIIPNIQAFSMETLSEEKQKLLLYFLSCGTYGTAKNRIARRIKEIGHVKYFLHRFFPDQTVLGCYHPIFAKYKWLLPIGWIYRACNRLIFYPRRVFCEIKTALKSRRHTTE